ncbi:hypothetical protein ABID56_002544 [Alkalibacillus flavidus]|uniref:Uncharacterized protein n=1 Tax=Alkalibacillus flavidus TaxID=546021 RepID=A0ABV2KZ46_9BACI
MLKKTNLFMLLIFLSIILIGCNDNEDSTLNASNYSSINTEALQKKEIELIEENDGFQITYKDVTDEYIDEIMPVIKREYQTHRDETGFEEGFEIPKNSVQILKRTNVARVYFDVLLDGGSDSKVMMKIDLDSSNFARRGHIDYPSFGPGSLSEMPSELNIE